MLAPARATTAFGRPRLSRAKGGSGAPAAAGATLVACIFGAAVGAGYAVPVLAVAVVGSALLVALADWRWSIYALLVYLPFSGLPTFATYPDTTAAVLLKDFLFVLPAYFGFVVARGLRDKPMGVPGAPLVLFGLLALLVTGQALAHTEESLVSAIGVKLYLFYIPLIFVGYHLVKESEQLHRLLGIMVAAATVPAAVGILQAILIYTGFQDVAYSIYGEAASEATQGFAVLDVGGAQLRRVPSTFSSVTEFYVFLGAMVAVTYAWWRSGAPGSRASRYGAVALALMVVAAFTCGARGAFLFIPLLLAAMVLLDRGAVRTSLWPSVAVGLALILMLSLLGTGVSSLFDEVYDRASTAGGAQFPEEMKKAFDRTSVGLGPGIDTTAARYAYPSGNPFADLGGVRLESYWAKAVIELGVAGLVLWALVFGRLLQVGRASQAGLRDPRLLAVGAALLGFLAWAVIYNVKASYLDLDPLNVYFWLFAGLLLKLPALGRDAASAEAPGHAPARDGSGDPGAIVA